MRISEVRQQALDMHRADHPFEEIEEMINEAEGINEEERSAVWLYAWSFESRGRQRYVARQAMTFAELGRRVREPEYAD